MGMLHHLRPRVRPTYISKLIHLTSSIEVHALQPNQGRKTTAHGQGTQYMKTEILVRHACNRTSGSSNFLMHCPWR